MNKERLFKNLGYSGKELKEMEEKCNKYYDELKYFVNESEYKHEDICKILKDLEKEENKLLVAFALAKALFMLDDSLY